MPETNKETRKEVLVLNNNRFKVFTVLRKFWDSCPEKDGQRKNTEVTKNSTFLMVEKAYPEEKKNKSPSFIWDTLNELADKEILTKRPTTSKRGLGSIVIFDPNWKNLESFDIISASGPKNENGEDGGDAGRDGGGEGNIQKQYETKLTISQPDQNDHSDDEDDGFQKFKPILITKSRELSKIDFVGSTLSRVELQMMFHDNAKIKVTKENEIFSIITSDPMECMLDDEPVTNNVAHIISPGKHSFFIENVEYLIEVKKTEIKTEIKA